MEDLERLAQGRRVTKAATKKKTVFAPDNVWQPVDRHGQHFGVAYAWAGNPRGQSDPVYNVYHTQLEMAMKKTIDDHNGKAGNPQIHMVQMDIYRTYLKAYPEFQKRYAGYLKRAGADINLMKLPSLTFGGKMMTTGVMSDAKRRFKHGVEYDRQDREILDKLANGGKSPGPGGIKGMWARHEQRSDIKHSIRSTDQHQFVFKEMRKDAMELSKHLVVSSYSKGSGASERQPATWGLKSFASDAEMETFFKEHFFPQGTLSNKLGRDVVPKLTPEEKSRAVLGKAVEVLQTKVLPEDVLGDLPADASEEEINARMSAVQGMRDSLCLEVLRHAQDHSFKNVDQAMAYLMGLPGGQLNAADLTLSADEIRAVRAHKALMQMPQADELLKQAAIYRQTVYKATKDPELANKFSRFVLPNGVGVTKTAEGGVRIDNGKGNRVLEITRDPATNELDAKITLQHRETIPSDNSEFAAQNRRLLGDEIQAAIDAGQDLNTMPLPDGVARQMTPFGCQLIKGSTVLHVNGHPGDADYQFGLSHMVVDRSVPAFVPAGTHPVTGEIMARAPNPAFDDALAAKFSGQLLGSLFEGKDLNHLLSSLNGNTDEGGSLFDQMCGRARATTALQHNIRDQINSHVDPVLDAEMEATSQREGLKLAILNCHGDQARIDAIMNDPDRDQKYRLPIVMAQGAGNAYNKAHVGLNWGTENRAVTMESLLKKARSNQMALVGSCGSHQEFLWLYGGHIVCYADDGEVYRFSNHGGDPLKGEDKATFMQLAPYTSTAGAHETKVPIVIAAREGAQPFLAWPDRSDAQLAIPVAGLGPGVNNLMISSRPLPGNPQGKPLILSKNLKLESAEAMDGSPVDPTLVNDIKTLQATGRSNSEVPPGLNPLTTKSMVLADDLDDNMVLCDDLGRRVLDENGNEVTRSQEMTLSATLKGQPLTDELIAERSAEIRALLAKPLVVPPTEPRPTYDQILTAVGSERERLMDVERRYELATPPTAEDYAAAPDADARRRLDQKRDALLPRSVSEEDVQRLLKKEISYDVTRAVRWERVMLSELNDEGVRVPITDGSEPIGKILHTYRKVEIKPTGGRTYLTQEQLQDMDTVPIHCVHSQNGLNHPLSEQIMAMQGGGHVQLTGYGVPAGGPSADEPNQAEFKPVASWIWPEPTGIYIEGGTRDHMTNEAAESDNIFTTQPHIDMALREAMGLLNGVATKGMDPEATRRLEHLLAVDNESNRKGFIPAFQRALALHDQNNMVDAMKGDLRSSAENTTKLANLFADLKKRTDEAPTKTAAEFGPMEQAREDDRFAPPLNSAALQSAIETPDATGSINKPDLKPLRGVAPQAPVVSALSTLDVNRVGMGMSAFSKALSTDVSEYARANFGVAGVRILNRGPQLKISFAGEVNEADKDQIKRYAWHQASVYMNAPKLANVKAEIATFAASAGIRGVDVNIVDDRIEVTYPEGSDPDVVARVDAFTAHQAATVLNDPGVKIHDPFEDEPERKIKGSKLLRQERPSGTGEGLTPTFETPEKRKAAMKASAQAVQDYADTLRDIINVYKQSAAPDARLPKNFSPDEVYRRSFNLNFKDGARMNLLTARMQALSSLGDFSEPFKGIAEGLHSDPGLIAGGVVAEIGGALLVGSAVQMGKNAHILQKNSEKVLRDAEAVHARLMKTAQSLREQSENGLASASLDHFEKAMAGNSAHIAALKEQVLDAKVTKYGYAPLLTVAGASTMVGAGFTLAATVEKLKHAVEALHESGTVDHALEVMEAVEAVQAVDPTGITGIITAGTAGTFAAAALAKNYRDYKKLDGLAEKADDYFEEKDKAIRYRFQYMIGHEKRARKADAGPMTALLTGSAIALSLNAAGLAGAIPTMGKAAGLAVAGTLMGAGTYYLFSPYFSRLRGMRARGGGETTANVNVGDFADDWIMGIKVNQLSAQLGAFGHNDTSMDENSLNKAMGGSGLSQHNIKTRLVDKSLAKVIPDWNRTVKVKNMEKFPNAVADDNMNFMLRFSQPAEGALRNADIPRMEQRIMEMKYDREVAASAMADARKAGKPGRASELEEHIADLDAQIAVQGIKHEAAKAKAAKLKDLNPRILNFMENLDMEFWRDPETQQQWRELRTEFIFAHDIAQQIMDPEVYKEKAAAADAHIKADAQGKDPLTLEIENNIDKYFAQGFEYLGMVTRHENQLFLQVMREKIEAAEPKAPSPAATPESTASNTPEGSRPTTSGESTATHVTTPDITRPTTSDETEAETLSRLPSNLSEIEARRRLAADPEKAGELPDREWFAQETEQALFGNATTPAFRRPSSTKPTAPSSPAVDSPTSPTSGTPRRGLSTILRRDTAKSKAESSASRKAASIAPTDGSETKSLFGRLKSIPRRGTHKTQDNAALAAPKLGGIPEDDARSFSFAASKDRRSSVSTKDDRETIRRGRPTAPVAYDTRPEDFNAAADAVNELALRYQAAAAAAGSSTGPQPIQLGQLAKKRIQPNPAQMQDHVQDLKDSFLSVDVTTVPTGERGARALAEAIYLGIRNGATPAEKSQFKREAPRLLMNAGFLPSDLTEIVDLSDDSQRDAVKELLRLMNDRYGREGQLPVSLTMVKPELTDGREVYPETEKLVAGPDDPAKVRTVSVFQTVEGYEAMTSARIASSEE